LLNSVSVTSNKSVAFKDADYIFLVSSKMREPSYKHLGNLSVENSYIYRDLGKAIGENAKRDCRVLVVGNPPHLNCLVCCHNAVGIPH
jgi:malate/lactate dehydrogenase